MICELKFDNFSIENITFKKCVEDVIDYIFYHEIGFIPTVSKAIIWNKHGNIYKKICNNGISIIENLLNEKFERKIKSIKQAGNINLN